MTLTLTLPSEMRNKCNQMAIDDMMLFLNSGATGVAIFDATNHTRQVRVNVRVGVNVRFRVRVNVRVRVRFEI
jgi:hypothetical protein